MLVFSRQKYGGPILDGVGVPGYLDPVAPVVISHRTYMENKWQLKQAPYTKAWFEARFGKGFPDISFTFRQIRYLSYSHLVALCQAFKITGSRIESRRTVAIQSRDRRLRLIREFLQRNA